MGRSCGSFRAAHGYHFRPWETTGTQIATRTGDDGTTGLGDGTRVAKPPAHGAMGDVDELNSSLGVLLAEPLPDDVRELLVVVQHELFNLGGELSIPGYELLKDDAVARLDRRWRTQRHLPRLQEFILPAGTRSAALAHVSRTVARRAERASGGAGGRRRSGVNAAPRQYLNRLSDLLFVLARVLNRANLGLGEGSLHRHARLRVGRRRGAWRSYNSGSRSSVQAVKGETDEG